MSNEYVEDYAASNAMIPAPAVIVQPTYAMVEIFGHRSHYGEIREVEAFGAKMLEVTDADTGKTHRYGGASIFSLTMLTQAEFEAHVASVKRRKQQMAQYEDEWAMAQRASGDTMQNDRPVNDPALKKALVRGGAFTG